MVGHQCLVTMPSEAPVLGEWLLPWGRLCSLRLLLRSEAGAGQPLPGSGSLTARRLEAYRMGAVPAAV